MAVVFENALKIIEQKAGKEFEVDEEDIEEDLSLDDDSKECMPSLSRYTIISASTEIKKASDVLIEQLVKFQLKNFEKFKGELAFKRKHRHYLGLRETEKWEKIGKALLVFTATNVDECMPKMKTRENSKLEAEQDQQDEEDESSALVTERINLLCTEKNVPNLCVYTRRQLAKAFKKRVKIAAVAIIDVNCAHESFKRLLKVIAAESLKVK